MKEVAAGLAAAAEPASAGATDNNPAMAETIVQPAPHPKARRAKRSRSHNRSRTWLLPLLFGLLFVAAWQTELFHKLFKLAPYQLPLPSAIAASLRDNADLLWSYSLYTGFEIVAGCFIGSFLGFILAAIASFAPKIGKGGIAMTAALNAIPIVALAPVMNNWFGDGSASKIAIVSVMTMATMAVGAYKGLRSIEPMYVELMTSYAASRYTTFIKLRLHNGLPYMFTALKINMATSIIGSIVGEFFISSRGLGFLLSDQIKLGNMPLAWSCITIAAVLGIVLYYLVQLAERLAIPWHIAQRK